MEKLDEYWSTNSVTSKFKINHLLGRPVGCERNNERIYSKTCGLGWRFAICYDNRPPKIDIFFDPHVTSTELGSLDVIVMLQAEFSSDEEFIKREEYSHCGRGIVRINSVKPTDIRMHPYVTFKVSFRGVEMDIPKHGLRVETRRALKRSMHTGVFIDTKFAVFSKRLQPGKVGQPLALFANGALLQEKLTYLKTHMSPNKPSDSPFVDLGPEFIWEEACTDKYDYDLDSDLDEDELVDDNASTVFSGMCDPVNSREVDVSPEVNTDVKSFQSQLPAYTPPWESFQSIGRTILVTNTAFKTWQACVLYLYSGEVKFLPLTSSGPSRSAAIMMVAEGDPLHPCSPKSMYRLAVKLGLHELKDLAFNSICAGLSKANILDEAFSEFTSRYPPILEMEVNILSEHFNSPEVSKAFPAKFKSIADGQLPHSSAILTSLFQKLAKKTILEI